MLTSATASRVAICYPRLPQLVITHDSIMCHTTYTNQVASNPLHAQAPLQLHSITPLQAWQQTPLLRYVLYLAS